ncbi:8742_t:CDS:1, partial [Ambispora leptoticha]
VSKRKCMSLAFLGEIQLIDGLVLTSGRYNTLTFNMQKTMLILLCSTSSMVAGKSRRPRNSDKYASKAFFPLNTVLVRFLPGTNTCHNSKPNQNRTFEL